MCRLIAGLIFALAQGACNTARTDYPVRHDAESAAAAGVVGGVTVLRLTNENIAMFSSPASGPGPIGGSAPPGSAGWAYLVGAGDILSINVWDHPDLDMPERDQRSAEEFGQRVQANGKFYYPYIGQVQAMGRTPEAIRDEMVQRLAEYIPEPQVELRVIGYHSQAVSVTGEVRAPRRHPLSEVPLTLLDAIDAAGGLTEAAEPRVVTLRRKGTIYTVDLDAFLRRGSTSGNPLLQPDDIVSVPRRQKQEAYLLGQISRPSAIDLTLEHVTLTQAITRTGGLKEDSADARGIFVFRNTPSGTTVVQLEAKSPLAYVLGTRFILHPQDVIYVTAAPLHKWNRLISSLLPTLSSARLADQIGG